MEATALDKKTFKEYLYTLARTINFIIYGSSIREGDSKDIDIAVLSELERDRIVGTISNSIYTIKEIPTSNDPLLSPDRKHLIRQMYEISIYDTNICVMDINICDAISNLIPKENLDADINLLYYGANGYGVIHNLPGKNENETIEILLNKIKSKTFGDPFKEFRCNGFGISEEKYKSRIQKLIDKGFKKEEING